MRPVWMPAASEPSGYTAGELNTGCPRKTSALPADHHAAVLPQGAGHILLAEPSGADVPRFVAENGLGVLPAALDALRQHAGLPDRGDEGAFLAWNDLGNTPPPPGSRHAAWERGRAGPSQWKRRDAPGVQPSWHQRPSEWPRGGRRCGLREVHRRQGADGAAGGLPRGASHWLGPRGNVSAWRCGGSSAGRRRAAPAATVVTAEEGSSDSHRWAQDSRCSIGSGE